MLLKASQNVQRQLIRIRMKPSQILGALEPKRPLAHLVFSSLEWLFYQLLVPHKDGEVSVLSALPQLLQELLQ